ncbi:Adenylyltransferase and sulfurtransferase MOCS3 [Hondaea fermentalgiana]|uniref:Adenylyltransferase and sulfurtransferase MOCS3 n=1 Tax=Hondaea fermentalgiana TaxID=2315210 RepID=A0A2R5GDT5_9STRA|nr:Adenylyltransferase and sulfurtransferase MOCS3 [Hondaea fermentalgiana]|eukprot:GBG29102.1 Adenylyltransferase and sulfurtransferase MOCS3 [Hondaea fermentalgiana]
MTSWREELAGLGEELLGRLDSASSTQAIRCLSGPESDDAEIDLGSSSPESKRTAVVLVAELAREVNDAERNTQLVLCLRTRQRGIAVENELELPCNVSASRLDRVLRGFVLSIHQSPRSTMASRSAQRPKTVHAFRVDDVSFRQPETLRQWHPNACGYHALFNAIRLLDAEPATKVREEEFWREALTWLRTLHAYNHVSKRWSSSGLRSVTLDQMQIAYLIDHDVRLRGRVGVFGSLEEVMALGDAMPRAIVFGCVTHWAAAAVHHESTTVFFAESFDKTCMQFATAYESRDQEDVSLEKTLEFREPRNLADAIMEDYHPKFIAKLRASHVSYAHMPAEALEDFYENGVPEYWKGKEKNSLYWTHRPRELRVFLLVQEIEAVAALVDHLFEYLSAGKRAAEPDHLLCGSPHVVETDLRAWCADQPTPTYASAGLAPGFVRRDEDWDPESEEYKSGRTVEHRKKPPPPEAEGDIFDRQRVMVDFDQGLVERQVCLVVGTGGVGQNTALTLARLGVECIILLDYDTVDASNLTRQCLSSRADVGMLKVDAARANLLAQHNLRSTVLTMNGDVLEMWPMVVELARMSTAIFNCADVGVMFDYCMASLAKELGLPIATGQSFAWKFMTEVYSGAPHESCAFCQETTRSSFGLQNLSTVVARWQDFVTDLSEKDANDDLTAILCDFMAQDPQYRMRGPSTQRAVAAALADVGAQTVNDVDTEETFSSFLERLHVRVMECLEPGRISNAPDVMLVPRPKLPETRFFGSWVCPCLSSGTMMVSNWLNMLTGPTGKNPPTNLVFNLDEGMTSEEQMSYEIGFGLSKEDRNFARSPSNPKCSLCKSAVSISARRDLFLGTSPTWLRPTDGRVFPVPQFMDISASECKPSVNEASNGANLGLVEPRLPARPAAMLATSALGTAIPAPGELTTRALIKCTEQEAATEPSSLRCSASGVRSAVVYLNGRAYRLKGCGNNEEGFVVEARGDNGEEMVRGCLFSRTSSTEMHMSERVREVLAPVGLRAGNTPVCFYQYETPHLPAEATCFCNVYETLGDRRLGDHLLAGLELLMPSICVVDTDKSKSSSKSKNKNKSADTARAVLQEARGMEGDEVWDTATMAECGMPVHDMRDLFAIDLVAPAPDALDHVLWAPTVDALEEALSKASGPSVLLQLAYVLGWQCGVTCSALQAAEISWGTYPDETGVHCNAHANNMVVLDAFVEQDEILAPVDFDMAFMRDAFDPEILDQAHQTIFPREWDDLVAMEQHFTSTGVSNTAAQAFADSPLLALIRAAFRDTIVSGFDAALASDQPAHAAECGFADTPSAEAARALIVLSLLLTKDVNA